MAKDGLGGLAKKWLQAKAKELTTADRHQRDAAEYRADETARQLKNDSIGEAVMTAVPGLRKLRDKQEASQQQAEERREREIQDELASRPVGQLELRIDGAVDATFRGTVPALLEVREPEGDDAEGDPFASTPTLVVDLGPVAEQSPVPGGLQVHGWRFEVPGYTGPGTYDLAASGMLRRDADAEPEYIDWQLYFGDEHEGFFFQPDIGPSVVTVTDEPLRLAIAMTLTGSTGDIRVDAALTLPG